MDEKSAKKGLKTGKKRPKNAKKPLKKSKFALAHLAKSTPSAEKSALAPAPGPMGFQKSPKNFPKTASKKFIHNRRRQVMMSGAAGGSAMEGRPCEKT